jgi:hypothetical protein
MRRMYGQPTTRTDASRPKHGKPPNTMKSLSKMALSLALVASAALNLAQASDTCHHAPPTTISASIFGDCRFIPELGHPAWFGKMLIKIGDQAVKPATFIDVSPGPPTVNADGSLSGTETITVTLDNEPGSFEIACTFEAYPERTPGMYTLHEIGKITKGTGIYVGMLGSVVIKGPFMTPDPSVNPLAVDPAFPPLWIAQLHGRFTIIAP